MCSIDKMVGGGLHDLRRSFPLPGLQCVLCKNGRFKQDVSQSLFLYKVKYEGQVRKERDLFEKAHETLRPCD